jgi:hypothetical protein
MVGLIITSVAAALLTYTFVDRIKWSPVKSSAILSLFFASCTMMLNSYFPFEHELYSVYFFGASFVGMSSKNTINSLGITLAGLLYGFMLYVCKDYFSGIGGALGSTACITVIVVFLSKKLTSAVTKPHSNSSV